jgi:vitamin B12 transporter
VGVLLRPDPEEGEPVIPYSIIVPSLFLCLVLPPAGESPSDESAPAETQPTEPLVRPHHEVTVTATRTPNELRELGRSVTVLTRRDLEFLGARNVMQVLETVPGFSVAQQGSYGGATSVFVRGGESDFNLVLVDGVPVNRPGGEFDFANLSTANIERIEIVRGPASVLYGTEAVASTIHIITRRGTRGGDPSGFVSAEAGGYGSFAYRGQVEGGSDRVRYSFGAVNTATDGIFDFNSRFRRTDLSASGVFDIGADSSLTSGLRYAAGRQHYPTDSTGAVVDPNDYRDTREEIYSLDFHHRSSTRYDTKLQYGFHRNHAFSYTLEDGVVDFFTDIFEAYDTRHYIDWQNNFLPAPGHLVTVGMSIKREASPTIDATRRSVGVYLQDQITWGERTYLTAGVRYDDNDRFSSFLTTHLDLAVLVDDSLKFRGSLGNGFRAPAFTEIVGFPDFGIAGNPELVPEKNVAFEAGVDYFAPDGSSRASATMFFNRFRDLIEFTLAGGPGSPAFLNVEAANARGLEMEGFIRLERRAGAGISYTYTATKVTDAGTVPFGNFEQGERLLRRPSHLANVYGTFSGARHRLRVDVKYKGSRDDRIFLPDFTSRRVRLPGYVKVDLAATVPLARLSDSRGELALILRGENVLDREYTEIAGFPSPGRRLLGGLELLF